MLSGACDGCRQVLSLYENIPFGQVAPGDVGCGAQID